MQARPYQQKALDEIRSLIAGGEKRILLHLATGAGKTFIFSTIFKGMSEKKRHGVMLVRGRALVEQAHKRLLEMGVMHGVHMAGHKHVNENAYIQLCSVDTFHRRPLQHKVEVVIIDEAHLALSETFLRALEGFSDAIWVGVTATPWHKKGMRPVANAVVNPITFKELVQTGWLCKPKYFAPPSFDAKGVKQVGGEFSDKDLLEKMEKTKILGDVRKSLEHGPALIFAINRTHALDIKRALEDKRCVVVTAHTSLDMRTHYQDELVNERLDAIISIGTMTTGVDIPNLRNIIVARPTMSKNLHIQMLGRGTRIYSGKDHFKVFDHVGNLERHGFMENESRAIIDPAPKINRQVNSMPFVTCKACFAINPIGSKACRECGAELKEEKPITQDTSVNLYEISPDSVYYDFESRKADENWDLFKKEDPEMKTAEVFRKLNMCWEYGYLKYGHPKFGWVWIKAVEHMGEERARSCYKTYRRLREKSSEVIAERAARLRGETLVPIVQANDGDGAEPEWIYDPIRDGR